MKRKIILSAVFTALSVGLCACSETDIDKSSIIISKSEESSDSITTEESSDSIISEESSDPIEIMNVKILSGSEYVVESGETLYVDGVLDVDDGGKLIVEDGAELLVDGEINLNGILDLDGIAALSRDAMISGSGEIILNQFEQINCEGTITARIVPPEPETINGVTTVGGVVIVNKKYSLPSDYGNGLTPETKAGIEQMRTDSGYSMQIASGFRSYDSQVNIFQGWVNRDGYEVAVTYSAEPGHSEHQTGLTADIGWVGQDYANSGEGKWLAANCYKYGFIIRYPKDMEHITGYIYEPWHIRYLGCSTAKLVHDSGLTLEEFLGVDGY